MGKKLSFIPCELDKEWERFIISSPDLSVYLMKDFLENTCERIGSYKCYRGKELRAVVALSEDNKGKSSVKSDFLIYSGVCFGKPTNNQSRSQQISERFDLSVFIIEELIKIYDAFQFQLSPSINDIRPFQWHNYGQLYNRCEVNIRYTSYLNISDFKNAKTLEEIEAYNQSSVSRRQQIRYAKNENITTNEFLDIEMFLSFYKTTLENQSITLEKEYLRKLHYLLNKLVLNKRVKMFLSKTSDGEPGSIAIFGIDQLRAYYLYGATNPKSSSESTGTAVLWDSFYKLASMNIEEVDLEGVNSPKRGWFKLSFGGILVPYFTVKYPNSKE